MLVSSCTSRASLRGVIGLQSNKRSFSMFQGVSDALVTIHTASGLPWVVLIPLGTIALRTVTTLPLSIWQRKRIVKQQELRKLVQAIPPVTKLRLAAATASKIETGPITSSGSAISETPTTEPSGKNRTLTPEQITLLAVKETRKRQKRLFSKYNVEKHSSALSSSATMGNVVHGYKNTYREEIIRDELLQYFEHVYSSKFGSQPSPRLPSNAAANDPRFICPYQC